MDLPDTTESRPRSYPAHFHLIQDFLTADECARLEARLGQMRGQQAKIGEARLDVEVRSTRVLFVKEDAESGWLWERLARTVARINADHFGFDLDGPPQTPQLGEYAASDGGHYGWHVDRGGAGAMGRRKLTISVLLSDPEGCKGGDLHLNATGQPFQVPRARPGGDRPGHCPASGSGRYSRGYDGRWSPGSRALTSADPASPAGPCGGPAGAHVAPP
ncbi:hypothetical protein SAMN02799631_04788 [Methylobacterium sp. 174MFSha1.1]|uniref:2OG-Fe(II) oxygenase family protein n=1 Tax=Methylobacterium sp. 174MFSha1.1 TaxID=1502749 RepID=UPI0008ECE93D|nr:hypothetical protein [Methylobacterium sp. 174MFSha1.1]SFV08886.1 hypothetical protein SAMN02799631_04788 [Methylobacterium sp. 174MFSha1.1]